MNSNHMLHLKSKIHFFRNYLCDHLRYLTTAPATELICQTHPQPGPTNPNTPIDQSHLIRVCTLLYQLQHHSNERIKKKLSQTGFLLTHEFFIQVCHKFPYSWRPVFRFYIFTQTQQPVFDHTSRTFNKMIAVVGRSNNNQLLWELTKKAGRLQLANIETFIISCKAFASGRQVRKCVQVFHIMNAFGYEFRLETLNTVVESLCKSKLADEAKEVVLKLKNVISPNEVTFKWLIYGYCDVGNVIEASKLWNVMVDKGWEPQIDVVEIMMERLFKNNNFAEALKLLQSVRLKWMDDLRLSSYSLVIKWLCKRGKLSESRMLLDEMKSKGIKADNVIVGSIVCALITKGRVNEAYKVVEGIEQPDINIYHNMIKGFVKLKKASEATQVFREMIKRGCEPTMHTYIMLLQGHLGKRGRRGKDQLVNFDTIFVGGMIKAGRTLQATKYTERVLNRREEVPRFDYNRFLYYFSNEEGVVMFASMAKRLREVGFFDLADIFERFGEKMTTRDRRINRAVVG